MQQAEKIKDILLGASRIEVEVAALCLTHFWQISELK